MGHFKGSFKYSIPLQNTNSSSDSDLGMFAKCYIRYYMLLNDYSIFQIFRNKHHFKSENIGRLDST